MKSNPIFCLLFLCLGACSQSVTKILPNDPAIQYTGRIDLSDPKAATFSYPGSSVKFKFEGETCNIHLGNIPADWALNFYNVIIDGKEPRVVRVKEDTVIQLSPGKGVHTVELFKRTENIVGTGIFKGIEIEKGKKLLALESTERKIEFIGNSITCGYGNEGTSPECHFSPDLENGYMSYAAITARNLNARYMAVAYSGKGVIQNYDLKAETMPEVYDRIFPDKKESLWDFKRWTPDLVVINLGTNDFAHNIPDSVKFVDTYVTLLKKIRKNYPAAHILCIEGSMIRDGWPVGINSLTLVKNYIEKAVDIFKKEYDSKIATFYLSTAKDGDFGCDYHPNVAKHQSMAAELTGFIKTWRGW